jgi:hypothetical protein
LARLILASGMLVALTGCMPDHITPNVPAAEDFDKELSRTLTNYMCAGFSDKCVCQYELLREGPTQSGIAYPKYYVWAKSIDGGKVTSEGALRLAAEDKSLYVTKYLSKKDILADPSELDPIFPAALKEKILALAKGM